MLTRILLACLSLFTIVPCFAQQLHLSRFIDQSSQERIYIHNDKVSYQPGETIWLKAYFYKNNLPSLTSNEVYIQLLQPDGKTIAQRVYPILGTTAYGDIRLPETLIPGQYVMRAFTPGQVSKQNPFIYYKEIHIGKALPASDSLVTGPSIHFYPEGGKLINGIRTKTAFQIASELQKPVAIEAYITTHTGDTITKIQSGENGLGSFELKPYLNRTYFVLWEWNGKSYKQPLPTVEKSGLQLKVISEKDRKLIYLNRSHLEKEKFDTVEVLAMINEKVTFRESYKFGNADELYTILPTINLPTGILHIFILGKDSTLLSERMTFVHPFPFQLPELKIKKQSFEPRGLNELEVRFPDTLARTLSITIQDAAEPAPQESIMKEFLFERSIADKRFDPTIFLQNEKDSLFLHFDEFLLTQKSKLLLRDTITYYDVQNNQTDTFKNITVAGTAIDPSSKKAMRDGTLNLMFFNETGVSQMQIPVKPDGHFRKDSLIFFGETRIFYTYQNKAGREKPVKLIMDKKLEDPFNLIVETSSVVLQNSLKKQVGSHLPINTSISDSSHFKTLQEVKVKAKINKTPTELLNERYTSIKFKNSGRVLLDNINHPISHSALSIVYFILNKIPKLQLETAAGTDPIIVNRQFIDLRSGRYYPIELFLDEIPTTVKQLEQLRIEDMAMIKYHEMDFATGAVSVYMKRPTDMIPPPTNKAEWFKIIGFSPANEFEHPDYSTDLNSKNKDQRTVLYWDPHVNMQDQSNTYSFNFYNNDVTLQYRVRIEGYDIKGNLIFLEKIIKPRSIKNPDGK